MKFVPVNSSVGFVEGWKVWEESHRSRWGVTERLLSSQMTEPHPAAVWNVCGKPNEKVWSSYSLSYSFQVWIQEVRVLVMQHLFTKHKPKIRHQETPLLISWCHWQTRGFVSALILCNSQCLSLVVLEWSDFRSWNPKTAALRETFEDTAERIWETPPQSLTLWSAAELCPFSVVSYHWLICFLELHFPTISLNKGARLKAPDLHYKGKEALGTLSKLLRKRNINWCRSPCRLL